MRRPEAILLRMADFRKVIPQNRAHSDVFSVCYPLGITRYTLQRAACMTGKEKLTISYSYTYCIDLRNPELTLNF